MVDGYTIAYKVIQRSSNKNDGLSVWVSHSFTLEIPFKALWHQPWISIPVGEYVNTTSSVLNKSHNALISFQRSQKKPLLLNISVLVFKYTSIMKRFDELLKKFLIDIITHHTAKLPNHKYMLYVEIY